MVTKKQKRRTVILVIILALVIVAGVFGACYYMGGYTAPWVAQDDSKETVAEAEPETKDEDVNLVIAEPEKEADAKTQEETKAEEQVDEKATEDLAEENEADVASLSQNFDYYGPLQVKDAKLCDSDGNEVQLIGVSSHSLSWYPEYITADSIKFMRDNWGINTIRLALYTSDYDGYCVSDDANRETLKSKIDEAVEAATDNDMYVIIDWHTLNDNDPNEYKSQAIQFFGEMVRKYESNENVIYEICNEPNGDTTWEDVTDYANEVIPVIREVDKDALILVGTPEWCQSLDDVMEKPLEFDNIMYTFHFYGSTHKAKMRNRLMDAVDSGLPVFISECGFSEADGDGEINTKEADNWIDVIKDYKLSACLWNLSNKDETSALIASTCDKTTDWTYDDLSDQGKFIYDYLAGESDEVTEETQDDN